MPISHNIKTNCLISCRFLICHQTTLTCCQMESREFGEKTKLRVLCHFPLMYSWMVYCMWCGGAQYSPWIGKIMGGALGLQ